MVRDCGFDLPDIRHEFYDTKDRRISVQIVRHWKFQDDGYDDDEPTFDVSFNILEDGRETVRLPVGTDESKASDVAHTLYEEDEEATKGLREDQAIRRISAWLETLSNEWNGV